VHGGRYQAGKKKDDFLISKARAFPVGIESEGFPTAVAKANLGKLIRLGS